MHIERFRYPGKNRLKEQPKIWHGIGGFKKVSDEFELKFPEPRRAWAFQFSSGNRAVQIYADK